jgi:hypothetical protein
MTAVQYSCPKSVKACALRMTFLEPSGLTQDPLTPERTVQGSGFVELALNPDYESPSEVVVRNPGSTVAVIHKDFDVLKGFEVSLKLCGINLVTALLGWTGFTSYDEATDTTSVNGWALNDDLGRPCVVQPAMLEVWSKNVADTGTTVDGCERWVHWVLPWTHDWTLASSITFGTGPVEIELSGYARANPWWFPAFPGTDFPSYDADGLPTGPAPTVLPPEVVTPDEWTLTDWATIRDSGPLAWKLVSALPAPLDDCTLIPGQGPLCNPSADIVPALDDGFVIGDQIPSPPFSAPAEVLPWL